MRVQERDTHPKHKDKIPQLDFSGIVAVNTSGIIDPNKINNVGKHQPIVQEPGPITVGAVPI